MRKFILSILAALSFGASFAHAAAGSLDPTFGKGGTVVVNISTNNNVVVQAAALQSDGKLVVQGTFGVARFLANASLDATFGSGGLAQLPFSNINGAVAIQFVEINRLIFRIQALRAVD